MSKAIKIWLIIAASLVLLGCMIFGGVMAVLNWNFERLGTSKMITNSYDITDSFTRISIDTREADVVFVRSDDGKCRVVCYERGNVKHSVDVLDDNLSIKVVDSRKWYQHIGIFSGTPMITVYLPESKYASLSIKGSTGDIAVPREFEFGAMDISISTGDVKNYASVTNSAKIKTSTGDIFVEGGSVGSLDLSVSTGHIEVSSVVCAEDFELKVSTGKTKLTDVRCKSFESSGSTGDISMKNFIVEDKMSVERSTGDVNLDGCDAKEIVIVTDTGDVEGSLLSEKVFIAKSDTGKIEHPKTASGGICEITTDTGDIKIFLK